MQLSQVTAEYVRALANPFTAPPASIPSYPALLSKRQVSFVRGSFVVPSGSPIGFVVCDPSLASANDQTCLVTSSSTYALTTIQVSAANVVTATSNSEYTAAQINTAGANTLQYRVVAAGLRVRYSDTELNRGGSVLALHHPQHLSLAGFPPGATGGYTIAQLESYQETRRFPATRNWTTVLYKPVDNSDLNFFDAIPSNNNEQFFMAIAVQGDASAATTWDYEFYVQHEFTGSTVRGKTQSAVDFVGFSAAHTAAAAPDTLAPHADPDHVVHQNFLSSVFEHLKNGVSWVKNEGVQALHDVRGIVQDVSGTVRQVGSMFATAA